MRLRWLCVATLAAFVVWGLPQLQSADKKEDAKKEDAKKEEKTEAKKEKDKEVKGKIPPELRKKIQDKKVAFGAVVIELTADGASQHGHEKAKEGGDTVMLEEGDIITHVDGKEIKSAEDYHKLMSGKEERKLTIIDINTGKPNVFFFKPNDGRLEIVFEAISSVG